MGSSVQTATKKFDVEEEKQVCMHHNKTKLQTHVEHE